MPSPAETTPEPTFVGQIAQAYLAQLGHIPEASTLHPDSGHYENAGITLAALALQNETDRFDTLVQDLSHNVAYQSMALAHGLAYAQPTAMRPLLAAVDKLDPAWLNTETRVTLMAAITSAQNRAADTTLLGVAWPNYKIGSDELFEDIVSHPYIEYEAVVASFQVRPFTEFRDDARYQRHMTELAIDFARSPKADRKIATGFGFVSAGELVVDGTLEGIHSTGSEKLMAQCAIEFTSDPKYSGIVTHHIAELFRKDDAAAPLLYESIQPNREHLTGVQELEIERAKYMARQGNTAEALAFAQELPNYTGRVWIMLNVARTLAAQGDTDQARTVLAAATELDPLAIEPYTEEGDPDAFNDMPEVDENDEASISAYNEEASIRATFLEKSRHDLLTERGYTLESVADTAAQLGAFDLAVEAFSLSRQYPMQTEVLMAREAVKQHKVNEYITALLACERLDDISKPAPLEAALTAFVRRPDRFAPQAPSEDITGEVLAEVEAYALALAERHQGPHDQYYVKRAAHVLAALGKYDTAQELMQQATGTYDRGKLTADIITHMAHSGHPADALALYLTSPDRPTESLSVETTLRAIIHNGMLLGDYDSARAALTELPDYKIRTTLGSIAVFESAHVGPMPDWMVGYALGPEKYGSTHDVKAIGQALLRAGVVKKPQPYRTLADTTQQ